MKKTLLTTLLALSAVAGSSSAFAYLPASAVTAMNLPVYGIYMSSDATCTTGMVATIPLSTTPQTINFVNNPVIGTADSLPSVINCVIIVIKNNFTSTWAAGSYSGTSYNGLTGYSDNISACNSGGTPPAAQICHSNAVAWPTQITTDAAAIGLTLTTGTCPGTSSDVVPLYLSTNAGCTGNTTADASNAGCVTNGNENANNWSPPTSVGDLNHGTRMSAPSVAGNLKFIVNPTGAFGATGAAACGNTGPPLFSFAAAD